MTIVRGAREAARRPSRSRRVCLCHPRLFAISLPSNEERDARVQGTEDQQSRRLIGVIMFITNSKQLDRGKVNDRKREMYNRKPRRDSDVLLSKFSQKEFLFKFLVIGDYGVGKTAIVRRYTEGKFSSNYKVTIGADFAIKSLDWDPQTKINLQIWDVVGHGSVGYSTSVYYKYAVAAALVFDISQVATFQSIKKWLSDLRKEVILPDGGDIPVVLLANKCDIADPAVPNEQIAKFCKEHSIGAWYVTSAKENTNVDEAMRYLVEIVMKTGIDWGAARDSVRLRDRPATRQESLCCE